MNKFLNVYDRRGHFEIISYVEKKIGLVIF
jgi:hypothetical protein